MVYRKIIFLIILGIRPPIEGIYFLGSISKFSYYLYIVTPHIITMDLQLASNLKRDQVQCVNSEIPISTPWGTLYTLHLLSTRYGFLHVPKCVSEGSNLVLIYHGSRDIAFHYLKCCDTLISALSERGYIIFFGQASGTIFEEPITHPKYQDIYYGDLYWGIRKSQNMEAEFEYTREAISSVRSSYNINHIFFIGHSNGGVFSLLLPIYMPEIFTAIVSHQGGLGYDAGFYIDFEAIPSSLPKPSILFYTSNVDVHHEACIGGYNLFKNMDFECELVVANEEPHGIISKESQDYMCDYIFKKVIQSTN